MFWAAPTGTQLNVKHHNMGNDSFTLLNKSSIDKVYMIGKRVELMFSWKYLKVQKSDFFGMSVSRL